MHQSIDRESETASKYRENVAQGIKFLSALMPDWIDRIDLGILDMEYPHTCIIGQLYGNYWKALYKHQLICDNRINCGFATGTYNIPKNYVELTEEWKRQILELRSHFDATDN